MQYDTAEDENISDLVSPLEERSEFDGYVDDGALQNPLHISSGDADEDDRKISLQRGSNLRRLEVWINFISDLSFLFGTLMYLWLTLSESKDVLLELDDIENIDDETLSKVGAFHKDIILFARISLYMLYGIVSGVLFMATGAFHLYTAKTMSDRVPYGFMVVASILFIASSSLMRQNPFWSKACFSISIHLFALQAATLLFWRISQLQSSTSTRRRGFCARILGDVLYLMATLCGIIISYLHLFDATHVIGFSHKYLAIATAFVWWLSSVVYLVQTSCELICPGKSEEDDRYIGRGGPQKSLPQQDTQSTDEVVQKSSSEEAIIRAVQEKIASRERSQDLRQDLEWVETNDSNLQDEAEDSAFDSDLHGGGENSVYSSWSDGPGPSDKELVAKSSLDAIFSATSEYTSGVGDESEFTSGIGDESDFMSGNGDESEFTSGNGDESEFMSDNGDESQFTYGLSVQ